MRDLMLITHFIGLAMTLGTVFSNLFLGIAAAKLASAERGKFISSTLILIRMGNIGLVLLFLSGFYLITPYWKIITDMPLLIAKLCYVALLVTMVSIITVIAKKAQRENNPAMLIKLKTLRMLNFLLGITVVVLAVLAFH